MTSCILVNISNIFFTPTTRFHFFATQFSSPAQIDLNNGLPNGHNWLAVKKLSLNGKKIKCILFHSINRPTQGLVPELAIDGTDIERVSTRHKFKRKHAAENPH